VEQDRKRFWPYSYTGRMEFSLVQSITNLSLTAPQQQDNHPIHTNMSAILPILRLLVQVPLPLQPPPTTSTISLVSLLLPLPISLFLGVSLENSLARLEYLVRILTAILQLNECSILTNTSAHGVDQGAWDIIQKKTKITCV